MHSAILFVFAYCIAMQLVWTGEVTFRELAEKNPPAPAAVAALTTYRAQGRSVDLATDGRSGYGGVGLQPYFSDEPFQNFSHRYWIWEGDSLPRQRYLADIQQKRVVAMVSEVPDPMRPDLNPDVDQLLALGYQRQQQYCANLVFPRFPHNPFFPIHYCYTFFTPPDASR